MNINYFENINTEKKAYFLGFILSDGCVYKKSNKIAFCIHPRDTYILEELKKELDCVNKIRIYSRLDNRTNLVGSSAMFGFSSEKMKKDLLKHGVSENKSNIFEYRHTFDKKYFNHFLRGVFDGDGHVGTTTKPRVSLISTLEFLNFINVNLFNSSQIIDGVAKEKNVYKLHIQKYHTVINFLDYIYNNATIYLNRKYERFLALKTVKDNFYYKCRKVALIVENTITGQIKIYESAKEYYTNNKISTGTLYKYINTGKTFKNLLFTSGEVTFKKIPIKNDINFINKING